MIEGLPEVGDDPAYFDAPEPGANGITALGRAIIMQAALDQDAAWFEGGRDFYFICAMADLAPEYVQRMAPAMLERFRQAPGSYRSYRPVSRRKYFGRTKTAA